jgi:hypothetical protein
VKYEKQVKQKYMTVLKLLEQEAASELMNNGPPGNFIDKKMP